MNTIKIVLAALVYALSTVVIHNSWNAFLPPPPTIIVEKEFILPLRQTMKSNNNSEEEGAVLNHHYEKNLHHDNTTDASGQKQQQYSDLQHCLATLPDWVHRGPRYFAREMWKASEGKTDKVGNPRHRSKHIAHEYQYMYWPYLSSMIRRIHCVEAEKKRPLRLLEIGLGCNPGRIGVGGSALAWHNLFHNVIKHELYLIEYDEGCARAWEKENPNIVTRLFTGDAASVDFLQNTVISESGNMTFDIIIDDGSHINDHQIVGIETLLQDWLGSGGIYIVEDMESSCFSWPANVGKVERGPGTGGTQNCLVQTNGKPTLLGRVFEWQKALMHWKRKRKRPFQGSVFHIDVHQGAVVFEKK